MSRGKVTNKKRYGRTWPLCPQLLELQMECPNCGEKLDMNGHFTPPCFGEKGFFMCEKKERNER